MYTNTNHMKEMFEWPNISPGEHVAIMFSGGILSTILSYLAVERYGKENVVLVFSPISDIGNSEEKQQRFNVRLNAFVKMSDLLQIDNRCIFTCIEDYQDGDNNLCLDYTRVDVISTYINLINNKSEMNVVELLFGHNKLQFEMRELVILHSFDEGMTVNRVYIEDAQREVESNSDFYTEIIKYDVLEDYKEILNKNTFYKVEESFSELSKIKFPFAKLERKDIVGMYKEHEIESLLRETISCTRDLNGCGECFNCYVRSVDLNVFENT